ncbi:hypothetical protein SAMN05444158_4563 [Bradyrhizobium canariense]|uniref:Uncharacterized protein n=2 Tax=Bradyrhizobium canariense TaxID=255045 RepID=A0A1H1XZJ6_9BRAD|nr:hypothetical protein SAMN05444158_4563 [Bradyrhizobium canariense]
MGNKPVLVTAVRPGRTRGVAMLSVIMIGLTCGMLSSPASAQSLTDRFKSLFGGKSDQPAQDAPPAVPPVDQPDLNCPPVSIRAGASTYAVGLPGKEATGADLRFQASITRTARDCTRTGGDITARIGIQGRVIAGPAGAPATVEIPMRVAVVQGGVNERTIATKAYRTTVEMSEDGSVPFTLVAEDLVYPAPVGAVGDSYIFYIGFDPQALAPEPKARAPKKKK